MKLNMMTVAALVLGTITFNATANKQLDDIIADQRREAQSVRDEYRHPVQTLDFFGVKQTDTVIELWPGGGWYTSILAPYLKDNGQLVAANFKVNGADLGNKREAYFAKAGQRFIDKVEQHKDWWGPLKIIEFAPPEMSKLGADNSADVVLTFRNLHNWHGNGGTDEVFAAAYAVLKPGGVFGVVEHRGKVGITSDEIAKSGYMNEDETIAMAKAAGFQLTASSEINANAKDTKDHPKGVWTLPPSLRLKDQDKDKYLEIGESDRMTLKFVKPAL
ncbi:class I SAM-dependent methyltransferase [Echinimonas agarilytica]|uniref:Methyltransferase n=1 Tax=Echinimonas agarilytica TaxID=1215918 RepID=A0AA41W661_9GAMM|nr:hypothetical protein [Echinimonas agarilytica]MCM2679431.1 hypothetical protein [Echinimonas agarilytica]